LTDPKTGICQGTVLCPGRRLAEHFVYVADQSFKCQRAIPMTFFDRFDGQASSIRRTHDLRRLDAKGVRHKAVDLRLQPSAVLLRQRFLYQSADELDDLPARRRTAVWKWVLGDVLSEVSPPL
jgi:hypothetical protein